jgi:hypothetical protein
VSVREVKVTKNEPRGEKANEEFGGLRACSRRTEQGAGTSRTFNPVPT